MAASSSATAGKQRIPQAAKVKNKAAAPVQITAEQLLREAKERELELRPPPPAQRIADQEELSDYKLRRRKTFEDNLRKNRTVLRNWIKYARWEESLKEIQRARSIYERALDVDYGNIPLWLSYAEMEMKNRQVNHARNVWERAVTTLPRVSQFWYKYTAMEEMLGNIAGARQVFERWMEWQPEEQAWHAYINLELRYREVERARTIYQRFVLVHPHVKNWIKYARSEEKQAAFAHARQVYERAVEFFGEEHMDERLFVAFAKFEENQKEVERARVIYKYALDRIPKHRAQELLKSYTIFEKKFGDRPGIEALIESKCRAKYEAEVRANPLNFDAWFDYLRLLESHAEAETVREVYERAVANVPPSEEKRHWKRYIYLWVHYALYEELEAKDPDRTRQVYQASLQLIPHRKFTFAKMWLYYAKFEIRQKNVPFARRVLGTSLGKCPKNKLFKGYIELELQLREFDRCRKLYEKWLEFAPENCASWIQFAEVETLLGDLERARAIYELAISQPRLDMPEVLWKSYIDFEMEQEETERPRNLYRRLLQRTQHVKVWISWARFELSTGEEGSVARCRQIYEEANQTMRNCEDKEDRLLLLESWRSFEDEFGTVSEKDRVNKLMPKKAKKRRKVQTDYGSEAAWEEYYDYIFPEDAAANLANLKLLAMAKHWKKQQQEKGGCRATCS
ncbi:crooked neck-like protein 1 [Perognathus longimembris pacificus]|uniref:crooked neck-like protein 1 n=1 Tax=Perognathus longimembris pacificus TaxID=214514 RepID=UPI002019F1C1|nr:crooked neck-like protein 1 [Perognathus longimembris pacificus]XP_048191699.1 crooked neck-like protein 1 [Perognathus longimembris pacificus]